MRAAILALLLVVASAQAFAPPDDAEVAEQRRIFKHLLAKPTASHDMPHQMQLWFGRTFGVWCKSGGECHLYCYQGASPELSYFVYVGTLPPQE